MRKWNGHTQHVWDDNGWRQSSDADMVRLQMQSNVRNIKILVTCESCIVCKISHCLCESVILKPMDLHNLQRSSLWLEHSLPESVWQQLVVYSARTPIHIVDQYFFKFHFIIPDHSPLLLDTWKLKENPKHRSKTPYLQWNVDSYFRAFYHSSAELLHLSNIKKICIFFFPGSIFVDENFSCTDQTGSWVRCSGLILAHISPPEQLFMKALCLDDCIFKNNNNNYLLPCLIQLKKKKVKLVSKTCKRSFRCFMSFSSVWKVTRQESDSLCLSHSQF